MIMREIGRHESVYGAIQGDVTEGVWYPSAESEAD